MAPIQTSTRRMTGESDKLCLNSVFNIVWFIVALIPSLTETFVCVIVCLCVFRSVPFESRVSTLFEWLELPESQRFSLFFIINTEMTTESETRELTSVFLILDPTFTLCTWRNLTLQDIDTAPTVHRWVTHWTCSWGQVVHYSEYCNW